MYKLQSLYTFSVTLLVVLFPVSAMAQLTCSGPQNNDECEFTDGNTGDDDDEDTNPDDEDFPDEFPDDDEDTDHDPDGTDQCESPPPDSEAERDRLARQIADEIRLFGYMRNERGAVIYFNGSTFRRDALDHGGINSLSITFETRPNEVVAAIVHSHTLLSYSAPTEADWSVLESQNTTPDGGAHYILNFDDNTLYEYDAQESPRFQGQMDGNQSHIDDALGGCDE